MANNKYPNPDGPVKKLNTIEVVTVYENVPVEDLHLWADKFFKPNDDLDEHSAAQMKRDFMNGDSVGIGQPFPDTDFKITREYRVRKPAEPKKEKSRIILTDKELKL